MFRTRSRPTPERSDSHLATYGYFLPTLTAQVKPQIPQAPLFWRSSSQKPSRFAHSDGREAEKHAVSPFQWSPEQIWRRREEDRRRATDRALFFFALVANYALFCLEKSQDTTSGYRVLQSVPLFRRDRIRRGEAGLELYTILGDQRKRNLFRVFWGRDGRAAPHLPCPSLTWPYASPPTASGAGLPLLFPLRLRPQPLLLSLAPPLPLRTLPLPLPHRPHRLLASAASPPPPPQSPRRLVPLCAAPPRSTSTSMMMARRPRGATCAARPQPLKR